MVYPIDNGTNNDCLIIHKDILRSIIKNRYTYTHYDDPLCWAKNLLRFLYGKDFSKEELERFYKCKTINEFIEEYKKLEWVHF